MPSNATNDRSFERSFLVPETEKRLFHLINALGIMLGGQVQAHKILHHAPRTARKILAKLKSGHKVVEHIMTVCGKNYKIYTLGPAGAFAMGIQYQPDYWFQYSDNELIQRLMSVDLYIRMCEYFSANLKVSGAEKPYVHIFIHGDKTYKIGVLWDNTVAFLEMYRWATPRERVILVCQSINQADGLLVYLDEFCPIRIITREKMKEGLIFYKVHNGKWVEDITEKPIHTVPSEKLYGCERF